MNSNDTAYLGQEIINRSVFLNVYLDFKANFLDYLYKLTHTNDLCSAAIVSNNTSSRISSTVIYSLQAAIIDKSCYAFK